MPKGISKTRLEMRSAIDSQVEVVEGPPPKKLFSLYRKVTVQVQHGLDPYINLIDSLKTNDETKEFVRGGKIMPFADALRAAALIILDWLGLLDETWNKEYETYMGYLGNIKKALEKAKNIGLY